MPDAGRGSGLDISGTMFYVCSVIISLLFDMVNRNNLSAPAAGGCCTAVWSAISWSVMHVTMVATLRTCERDILVRIVSGVFACVFVVRM